MSELNPFKDKPPERTWRQCGIAPLQARTDDAGKKWIDMPVVGMRSDGMLFTVMVMLDAEAIKLVPSMELVAGMHYQLMLAFSKLELYRTCDCVAGLTCRMHSESRIIAPEGRIN